MHLPAFRWRLVSVYFQLFPLWGAMPSSRCAFSVKERRSRRFRLFLNASSLLCACACGRDGRALSPALAPEY
jgi:hypothetical protein